MIHCVPLNPDEIYVRLQAPAERMIRDCVSCELAYINTDHPAFIGGNRAIAAVLGGQSDASATATRARSPVARSVEARTSDSG